MHIQTTFEIFCYISAVDGPAQFRKQRCSLGIDLLPTVREQIEQYLLRTAKNSSQYMYVLGPASSTLILFLTNKICCLKASTAL
jgi:hypothetical protein